MSDNEKRAHDLAIACVLTETNPLRVASKSLRDEAQEPVDVYEIYKSAYFLALEAINRDFPD